MIKPPCWTTEQLETDLEIAKSLFREERMREPLEHYLEGFDRYRASVENLLEMTVDLSQLTDLAESVVTDPALLEALRYIAGPPISADDLKELAETTLSSSRLRDPATASRVIEIVLLGLDRNRFPWVSEMREPTPNERESATLASAALMASRRVMTDRATESKEAQERAVADRLMEAGLNEVPTRNILTLGHAPDFGEFCRESPFAGRKADLVIRLWDGRVMPIECKVSNSSTNSVKRLNNDAAVKAGQWLHDFGSVQTVPVAVLSGVFKRRNLESAQSRSLTIFWAHYLEKMIRFIEATRKNV